MEIKRDHDKTWLISIGPEETWAFFLFLCVAAICGTIAWSNTVAAGTQPNIKTTQSVTVEATHP